jgi:hypothetical protein
MAERQTVLAAPARRDPVVIALQAAAAVLVLVLAVMIFQWAHREQAMANLHCPPQDHAVWADSLGPWWNRGEALCGASLVISGTSR